MQGSRFVVPLAILCAFLAPSSLRADCTFTDVAAGLPALVHSSVTWGDYDNDGDLDFLLTGSDGPGSFLSRVYRNSGGANPTFSDIGAGLIGVAGGGIAWGDYDNDGDLDILLTGLGSIAPEARVYRNDGGANPTFTDVGAALTGTFLGAATWGDYDSDGDLDILLTGDTGSGVISKVYRNGGGTNPAFTDIGAGLIGVTYSAAAWGDYDKDGDLDILLTGSPTVSPATTLSRIYRNNAGGPTFSDISANLVPVASSSVAWGDYDSDGDLDIALAGSDQPFSSTVGKVYRNNGGANPTFSDIGAAVSGAGEGSVAWGDYDNDGDLDVALTGWDGAQSISHIYRTSGGSFSEIGAGLIGSERSALAWGDYDNDGDLDLLLSGSDVGTRLYRNSACSPNTPPSAPTGLHATHSAGGTTFSWSAATDAQTPTPALTYNLRVGTTPGGDEIFSGMAAANGYRKVARHGNAGHRLQWSLKRPLIAAYYWSVQAVDAGFAGSPFAAEFTTGVSDETEKPAAFSLSPARPNPFSTTTSIGIDLSRPANVNVHVYDVSGRLVRSLARDRSLPAGQHDVTWDGRDARGRLVGNGAYLCTLDADDFRTSRVLVLMR